ncbi:SDR family NAD(P)-dependent oxidoreductase [Martelella alba]|uniref:Glucose 1-dehydrogenase n=1 Tax=Martelella alba TaxID=2590451 RepID=A0ABY2SM64_9HYPH|nr:glucose 1-dehydrogenase [Martelella alba]TKI06357.1 glucose 1-dehydrogenase [Martelella alba]
MSQLTKKSALVTGASKGIGAAIAKGLAAAGASVIVNYASDREGAEQVVAAITAGGGQAVAVQGDVAKSDDVRQLFLTANGIVGALDILVNNAGVFRFDPIEQATEDEFHRQFNINVLGTFLATREALRYFSPQGGSIINISSVASTNPTPHSSIYAATKGAVDTLTVELARELGDRLIRVNAIAPGGVATEGTASIGVVGSDFEKAMVDKTPLGRFGQPDDIAKVAVFLASDQSAWLTGERLAVSGGWY